ncbi:MAG: hypothetical protein WKF43_16600 [Acidimicrobiales bacterium]
MTVDAVTLFLALLAIVAQAGVAFGLTLAIGGRVSTPLVHLGSTVARSVGDQALVGLRRGRGGHGRQPLLLGGGRLHALPSVLVPADLHVPLVPLLGLAAWRRDLHIRPYAAVLAVIGALVAAYHVLVERFPTLESDVCDPTNPCTLVWVRRFGYLTIPTMALSAFVLILTLLAVARHDSSPH